MAVLGHHSDPLFNQAKQKRMKSTKNKVNVYVLIIN